MLYIFTGNGKGKTTAALGLAMRAVGEGKRVLMVQFIKGPWASGEDIFTAKWKNQNEKLKGIDIFEKFEIVKTGLGFVGILGDSLPFGDHKKAAEEGLAFAGREAESGKWDIMILDEVNNAVHLGLISVQQVLDFMEGMTSIEHIILTGRDAPQEFIELADLVTEMREVKHQYTEGKKARRGLEY